MTGGYKATRTGRTMDAGYAIWDVDNGYYLNGQDATVYATFDAAAKAARVQTFRDIATRQRAGTGKGPQSTGRKYTR